MDAMTAPIRIRPAGRSLMSLGLLMMAVVIGIGAVGWGTQHPIVSTPGTIFSSSLGLGPQEPDQPSSGRSAWSSSPDGASISAKTPDAIEFALLPQHVRLLAGLVVLTGLTGGSLPYWAAILGLGLYASTAAGRKRLRRLFCGCRHGTRAPPLSF
jgi:hypothetical protein